MVLARKSLARCKVGQIWHFSGGLDSGEREITGDGVEELKSSLLFCSGSRGKQRDSSKGVTALACSGGASKD